MQNAMFKIVYPGFHREIIQRCVAIGKVSESRLNLQIMTTMDAGIVGALADQVGWREDLGIRGSVQLAIVFPHHSTVIHFTHFYPVLS
jgi:hypothetical protein